MQFHKVREYLLQGKNIQNIPLKVTFYARVSTESDEQLNSLDNQISYFKELIESNPSWTYVDGYIDEGISGSSAKKRRSFMRMIEDSKKGYFDLILTKEVSRFSRNLADSIKYIQELLKNDVGVYFQSNGINTYDPNSEFILNMMGSVAQEEVKRLSSRVKWGHREAIKKGKILGSGIITGYKKEDSKLVIDDKQANIVRLIFELYATNKYGFYKLAMELEKRGIKNSKGNIYDKDTLKRIIENPKYKGYYQGHTTEVIDYRTKKRIKIPKEERVIYKDDNIPAIVTEELWERANKILERRSKIIKAKDISNRTSLKQYPYSGIIICQDHNSKYQRTTGSKNNKVPRWACSNYMRYRLKSCISPIIKESELDKIFIKIMNKIFTVKKTIIDEMKSLYQDCNINNIYEKEIKTIEKNIDEIIDKKERILELNINGNLSDEEFQERNEQYNRTIAELQEQKNKTYEEQGKEITIENKIKEIELAIKEELTFQHNIQSIVDKFVGKIIVTKIDNNRRDLLLDIYLNFKQEKSLVFTFNYKDYNSFTCNIYS